MSYFALDIFYTLTNDLNEANKNLKQKAIDEYVTALKMPRKKKKIAKISAIQLYSIACWVENLLKH